MYIHLCMYCSFWNVLVILLSDNYVIENRFTLTKQLHNFGRLKLDLESVLQFWRLYHFQPWYVSRVIKKSLKIPNG
jgi:hypothetical protein